ncbi:MAG: hypothetical protein M1838_001961 [Thelocarpon superellum]|nr:MAG: hypothetical protein M1838_001961 [Thelocarpon superellum]
MSIHPSSLPATPVPEELHPKKAGDQLDVSLGIADDRQAEQLKARIERLEETLQQLQAGQTVTDNEPLANLSDEERTELRQLVTSRLRPKIPDASTSAWRGAPNARSTPSSGTALDLASVKGIAPRAQRVYLNRFAGYLKQVERQGHNPDNPDNRKQLWRWYLRCRQNIPTFRAQISKQTWQTLWDSQRVAHPSNPDRVAHLAILGDDLQAGGHQLTGAQQLEYIEALFLDGAQDQALSEWRRHEATLSDGAMAEEFWVLGVRMLAARCHLEEAQDVARRLLDGQTTKDYRILVPVIDAWNTMGGLSGFQNAWALYIRLKEGMGSDMAMPDYDAVCQSFLKAGKVDLALAVFKDMMLTQDPSSDQDSSALYRQALTILGDIRDLTIEPSETNRVNLEAMAVLPRPFQNKFFYGSWIKKLLGAGEPEYADLVVDLIRQRGIRPDSRHLNGIMAAFIRQADAKSFERAEAIGWEMIERRKTMAFQRRARNRKEASADGAASARAPTTPRAPPHPLTPAATLETFAILVEYYLARANHDAIRWLHRSISLAEIRPSAYFLNCVLQSELKSLGPRAVWQSYKDWVRQYGADRPDVETFQCLWESVKCVNEKTSLQATEETNAALASETTDQLDLSPSRATELVIPKAHASVSFEEQSKRRRETGFPSARGLFATMMKWFLDSPPPTQSIVQREFSPDLYHLIMRCFSPDGSSDWAGGIVAMYALKTYFAQAPNDQTVQLMVLQLARQERRRGASGGGSGGKGGGEGKGVRRRDRRDLNTGVRNVSRRLEQLTEQRIAFLEQQGIDLDHCDEAFRTAENLHLLAQLLRTSLARRPDAEARLDRQIERAAWDMGVGALDTGDHVASPAPVKEQA